MDQSQEFTKKTLIDELRKSMGWFQRDGNM